MADNNKPVSSSGPISIEAEEAVLGSILINPEAFSTISEFLQASDFYELRHRWIWSAMLALNERSEEIDNLTIADELRNRRQLEDAGGSAYITYLIHNTPTHIYAETYARIVERAAIRRRLMEAAGAIAQLAREEHAEIGEVISKAEATLFGVTDQRLRQEMIPMGDAVREYYERIEHLYTHPDEQLGLPTGFTDLDHMLGGMQKSDLIIVAARPGVGKTSFLLSLAMNTARKGARIAIFSLEMGREQLIQRFYAVETGINSQRLRLGKLEEGEWSRFTEATSRLDSLRLYIDDTPGISVQQMRARCRRLYREQGIDLVVVDYLQLMSSGSTNRQDNRVQEISYISRGLKELARELHVPVISAAQLSRSVEQRTDKRPQLSDLRESGCLSGDTLVYLPESGRYVPIRNLNFKAGFQVASLNTDSWKIESRAVVNAFYTGIKSVYRLTTQLGRTIRATGNHKFLTFQGWKRLDELAIDDVLAVPRILSGLGEQTLTDSELALLGHLIGDGCTLPNHAIQYTTREEDLAQLVVKLAKDVFGDTVVPRISHERTWYQVYLPPSQHLTHGIRNPVAVWLEKLGLYGMRSYQKRIPSEVFGQPEQAIACCLRHLWATDGCIGMKGEYPAIYYASSSKWLARDVQSLLIRVGINARLAQVSQNGKGRDQYHVIVSGNQDLMQFIQIVGAVGQYKQHNASKVQQYLENHLANTNRDVIPSVLWRQYVVPAMQSISMTSRQMQSALGNAYCGTGLYKQNISRVRAAKLAQVVRSEVIDHLAHSDVYWDRIASIEPDGETDVYDLTVPDLENFVANDIIVHNSIEQDSDVVVFLYRDELYHPETDRPNQADVIVSKHRNGPTGTITLYFRRELTQFLNMTKSSVDLSQL